MKLRVFRQLKKSSLVKFWLWNSRSGLWVVFKDDRHAFKSDYKNVKELLKGEKETREL